jgi:hypothetical protein
MLLATLALLAAATAHAKSFRAILETPVTQPISDALAKTVAHAYPLVAASAGFIFSYDEQTGAFVRETEITGQLFLERAEPIGRGRWNASLSYQWVRLDTFEGEPLRHLSDVRPPIVDPNTGNPVTFPHFGVDLDTNQVTAGITYGVTNDLELNLALPIITSSFHVSLDQTDTDGAKHFSDSASHAGVGDLFLRGKYRLFAGELLQAAAGLVLRFPTGNEDNFQGTGAFEVTPLVYLSTRWFRPSSLVGMRLYFNGGMDFDTSDVDQSEAVWGVGIDGGIGQHATLSVSVLGRDALSRIAPAGFFSVLRTDGQERPIFGINGDRPDVVNLALGGRVEVLRDHLIVFANVTLPLNQDEGVRSDVIPTAGFEVPF